MVNRESGKVAVMKTMSAMQVRRQFGAVLDEVRIRAVTIVLQRAGKPVAMLTPVEGEKRADDPIFRRRETLERLDGLGAKSPRARDTGRWLNEERDSWR